MIPNHSIERTRSGLRPPRDAHVQRWAPQQHMMARLDHISVVAPNLEVGAAYVEASLGVAPGAGRTHPSMATHNLLLALGPAVYLEVISADPGAAPISRPRWFGLDRVLANSTPRLGAWVASTDDIDSAAAPELGEIETMRREAHTWQMRLRSDGAAPMEGAAPLLIQRAPEADPIAALPLSGLLFKRLLIQHPAPAQIIALFQKLQLASTPTVSVTLGSRCSLVAEIQTPSGTRRLGED
jgi:Glyoxalase-like domain